MATTAIRKTEKFNKLNLIKRLNNLEIKTENGVIATYIRDKKVCEWTPKSPNYVPVNFKDISKSFISKVGEKLELENMELKLYKGIQELKLFGDRFEINGEVYQKMATLLSSTDGTRNLQVRFGLFRQICTNGMLSCKKGVKFSSRHLSTSEGFNEMLEMNTGIETMVEEIQALEDTLRGSLDQTISLSEIKKGLVTPEGKNAQKYLSFITKLISSKTDRIENLTTDQIKAMRDKDIMLSEDIKFDLEIPKYKAIQCYTELFRKHDTSIIAKETERILEIV